jgi:hypothetical protein
MDPLLEQLKVMNGFAIEESHNVSALAFADDLIITATKNEDAQALLLHTERYLQDLGITIAAKKSATFEVRTTNDSWYLADPDLHLISGDRIPSSAADSTLCYLGGHISLWSRPRYQHIIDDLQSNLDRCRTAHLKPHQKLSLICSHILPHILHKAVLATPTISTIHAMDQTIRNSVKPILHLPMSTPNGLLYCSRRDGGLGIPKLETLIPCTALKQGITLLNNTDPTILALLKQTRLKKRLEDIAKSV